MAVPKSQALALFKLLETGAKVPKGTGHITADPRLCVILSRRLKLPADFVFELFEGRPVKAVNGIYSWCKDEVPDERLKMLRNWARKRGIELDPETVRAAIEAVRGPAKPRSERQSPGEWTGDDEATRERILARMGGG